jgi:hypothetical protein
MYQAHKTDSVKGTMTIVPPLSSMPAPLVASLLQYRSSLTPIVSSYSYRSCPCAIEIILAIAINQFLAIFFQRLLGMVPKWNGSRQTLRRLKPMPVNTQERMERRRCARSLQHRCSSIHPFSHCQFASSHCLSCTRPQSHGLFKNPSRLRLSNPKSSKSPPPLSLNRRLPLLRAGCPYMKSPSSSS